MKFSIAMGGCPSLYSASGLKSFLLRGHQKSFLHSDVIRWRQKTALENWGPLSVHNSYLTFIYLDKQGSGTKENTVTTFAALKWCGRVRCGASKAALGEKVQKQTFFLFQQQDAFMKRAHTLGLPRVRRHVWAHTSERRAAWGRGPLEEERISGQDQHHYCAPETSLISHECSRTT